MNSDRNIVICIVLVEVFPNGSVATRTRLSLDEPPGIEVSEYLYVLIKVYVVFDTFEGDIPLNNALLTEVLSTIVAVNVTVCCVLDSERVTFVVLAFNDNILGGMVSSSFTGSSLTGSRISFSGGLSGSGSPNSGRLNLGRSNSRNIYISAY